MNFTEDDIKHIASLGLTVDDVYHQITLFKSGVNFADIQSAATIGNGILPLDDTLSNEALSFFESHKEALSMVKFVPASGAATRMFKFLYEFLKDYKPIIQSLNAYINRNHLKELPLFLVGLEKFPFYDAVLQHMSKSGIDYYNLPVNEKAHEFVKTMLDDDQLNFGNYPKGLFPFHKYNSDISTAFEEHLFEMALYGSRKKALKLHFTISEAHKDKFTDEFKRIEERVEKITKCSYDISFSYQHKSTDTIALTLKDKPFRNDDGCLYFRPSGHGALLKNLNNIDADLIFIGNIDNVVVKKYKTEVAKYKKVLAGILLQKQQVVFEYIGILQNTVVTEKKLNEIALFLTQTLNVPISEEFKTYSHKRKLAYLLDALDRPLRVCGMVKNEGEPGGGPFWVKNETGQQSLQIVESAQINTNLKSQKKILDNATHFNPVDIVCSIKNYKGETFDLQNFVDKNACFITMKTKLNHNIKALELPGLWNGSMAYWNSIFVEVPIITFNPVKTVNDLLKAPHQTKS